VVKQQCYCCRQRSVLHGCHVADWYMTRHSLATHLCGDGRSWPLINGVGGRSWTIVGGVGPLYLVFAGPVYRTENTHRTGLD
jgi:hypothetical protein